MIYQKLLPIICPHCSIKLNEDNIPNKYSLEKIISDNKIISESDLFKLMRNKPQNLNVVRFLQDIKAINSIQAEFILNEYKIKNPAEEKRRIFN